jgi:folate-binding protein YgfZ
VNPTDTLAPSPRGRVRLADWGVIRAVGPDARCFLHGQLTQDVEKLPAGRARLAGYCSAKGRLLATFVIWPGADPDELLLACSADLLPAALRRLSMFVMRAQCTLSDASSDWPIHGLLGKDVPAGEPWQLLSASPPYAIRLPDVGGVARALQAGPVADDAVPAGDLATWQRLEVMSGVPRVVAATVEQFVPQMINFELVDGVNFQKGCYPGQEVVARSQYRGTLKRRAYLARATGPLVPGQEVFADSDPGQPAGQVVLSAAGGADQGDGVALITLKTAAAHDALHAGSAHGPLLALAELPYAVPAAE